MKKLLLIALLLINSTTLLAQDISVCFSPNNNCTDKLLQEIHGAKKEVLVQAYSFTSYPIVDALIAAKQSGVLVNIVVDKSQLKGKGSLVAYSLDNKLSVAIDSKHTIAHNKIMIIDESTIVTGSFNFTRAAEVSNAENLVIIKNCPKPLVEQYKLNFIKHKSHSINLEQ